MAVVLSALAGLAGTLGSTSQGSITISASVAARTWLASGGTLCSNIPAERFGLVSDGGRAAVPAPPGTSCGAGAASQVVRVRIAPGTLLIIVAE